MIGLIWAQAHGGVIGHAGGIPWRLPEDQARFKELTLGSSVLMGRLTWESLPDSVRPLPGRRNLVLTSQSDWRADGAERVSSLEAALATVDGDLWVIGGAALYLAALQFADRVVVTEIDGSFPGDVFAPQLDPSLRIAQTEPDQGWLTSTTGLRFKVTTYERDAAIPSVA
ncbi:MAG: dihydrofolate reductase [Mycobacteriales bacterium]